MFVYVFVTGEFGEHNDSLSESAFYSSIFLRPFQSDGGG